MLLNEMDHACIVAMIAGQSWTQKLFWWEKARTSIRLESKYEL